MKKIDKLYKNEFNKVEMSSKDKNRIYNNIVSNKKNNYYFYRKLAIVCSILLFVSLYIHTHTHKRKEKTRKEKFLQKAY